MKPALFAVVVSYFPDPGKLQQLCQALALEASVIVVDNTPAPPARLATDSCTWIANGENLGIASAQNIGIREALRQGAQAVAFFDQDSELSAQLLPTLRAALAESGAGVVVPVCSDAATGKEYPSFRLNRFGWPVPVYLGCAEEPVPVDLAISSGSLAASIVFQKAGLMDDGLFIDYVDFEWWARVRAQGQDAPHDWPLQRRIGRAEPFRA
jgi:rhamnosyltransferase